MIEITQEQYSRYVTPKKVTFWAECVNTFNDMFSVYDDIITPEGKELLQSPEFINEIIMTKR